MRKTFVPSRNLVTAADRHPRRRRRRGGNKKSAEEESVVAVALLALALADGSKEFSSKNDTLFLESEYVALSAADESSQNDQEDNHQPRLQCNMATVVRDNENLPNMLEKEEQVQGQVSSDDNDYVKGKFSQSLPQLSSVDSAIPPTATNVDIVMNTNAKGITSEIVTLVERLVIEEATKAECAVQGRNTTTTDMSYHRRRRHLHVKIHATSTMEEAKMAAQDIVNRKSSLVIPMGGDGTLTTLLQFLWESSLSAESRTTLRSPAPPPSRPMNGDDVPTIVDKDPAFLPSSTTSDDDAISSGGGSSYNTTSSSSSSSSSTSSSSTYPMQFPKIAYIAMGTGNALGPVVGCRPSRTGSRLKRWSRALLLPWSSFFGRTTSQRRQRELTRTLTELLQYASTSHENEPAATSNNHVVGGDPPSCGSTPVVDIVEIPMLQVRTSSTTTSTTTTPTTISTSTSASTSRSETLSSSSLCFFSGVGFDSLMLQDFKNLQEWTTAVAPQNSSTPMRRWWKDSFSSVLGYCVALVTRTLPQCLREQKHLIHVEISTRSPESTVWIDHRRGDVARNVHPMAGQAFVGAPSLRPTTTSSNDTNAPMTTLLYRGQAGIVAVGSAPYYGGGLRLFPFARMSPHGMQLRIGRIHPLRGTVNIPGIFQGSYRDTRDGAFGCLDFMGPHFAVTILDPTGGYPVQHSGDFIGTTTRVEFSMIPDRLRPISFVTLLPPRLVVEREGGSSDV